jgi:hypothetical protein
MSKLWRRKRRLINPTPNLMREETIIHKVCSPCGITANYLTCLKKYGKPPIKKAFTISTFHIDMCDVCGEKTGVTEARDFFYPDFSLILKKIK